MRLTLIHNAAAGSGDHRASGLVEFLSRSGYAVTCFAAGEADIAQVLALPADLVVAAGGDGTVAKVAARSRPGACPIAIPPLGTANNIARSFSIEPPGHDRPLEQLVSIWKSWNVRPFHRIDSEGPWGYRCLVEGIGVGVFEQAIADMPEDKPDPRRAREMLAAGVDHAQACALAIGIDGHRHSGRFLLVEITNLPLLGPNLYMVPAADPSDGIIETCLVNDSEQDRRALQEWLSHGKFGGLAPMHIRSGRRVTMTGQLRKLRLDGKVWSNDHAREETCRPASITLEPEKTPIAFLAPVHGV